MSCSKEMQVKKNGAQTEGMAEKLQAQLETDLIGRHQSLALLVIQCCGGREESSIAVFSEAVISS